jgi:hypothetical protein
MDFKEIVREGVEWVHLAQDKDNRQAVTSTEKDFGIH